MKKLIVPLFLQFSLLGFCKAQNLTIIEQDYNLARQESIAQKKMLIIDFYATWCGPCKVMDKKVFNDSLLSSELSKNFVLLKYNGEKDSVFNLALKHHIKLYPTYIIINTDGYVVNKQFDEIFTFTLNQYKAVLASHLKRPDLTQLQPVQ